MRVTTKVTKKTKRRHKDHKRELYAICICSYPRYFTIFRWRKSPDLCLLNYIDMVFGNLHLLKPPIQTRVRDPRQRRIKRYELRIKCTSWLLAVNNSAFSLSIVNCQLSINYPSHLPHYEQPQKHLLNQHLLSNIVYICNCDSIV